MGMGEIIVRVGLKDVLSVPLTMNDVGSLILNQFKIPEFISGKKREVVTAKFLFSYYCKVNLGISNAIIGNYLNLSRTAVVHQVASAKNYLEVEDEEFTNALKELEQNIELFKLQNL